MLLAALSPAPAQAQQVNELLAGSLNGYPTDNYLCATEPCNLWQRYWGDADPREINGPAAGINGYPRYAAAPDRYVGDTQLTGNFPTASLKACEAWYSAWSGLSAPTTGTFITYYATQSQIVNFSESGQSNLADCNGLNGQACFGAVDATFAGPASPGGPAGLNIPAIAGSTPVPTPGVAFNAGTGNLDLTIPAAAPSNNLNIPSVNAVACPISAPFNDLVVTAAPQAVWGIGLFAHVLPSAAQYRTLYDLEGVGTPANADGLFGSGELAPGSNLSCAGTGGADCPGVFALSCTAVGGTGCRGALFPATGGSVSLSQAEVEAAIGGPLGTGNTVVFNTKVFYRGSVAGSHANPSNTQVNSSLVSPFSANSPKSSFSGLAARVTITRTTLEGNRVTIDFAAVGEGFVSFDIFRADDGMTFNPVGVVDSVGAGDYSFTDTLRGRRGAQATYKVLATDVNGVESQVFTTVNLVGGSDRGPRR